MFGLPSSFLICRRACLSCGLHSSESAVLQNRTMMSTVMLKRAMFAEISTRCGLICEKWMLYRSMEGREIQRKRESYIIEHHFWFIHQ